MIKQKIKQILIGVSVIVLLWPTSVFADDEISVRPSYEGSELSSYPSESFSPTAAGSQTLYNLGDIYFSTSFRSSPTYTSDGGDFEACIFESTVVTDGVIEFWEEDPGPENDDFIGWGHFKNNHCVIAKVGAKADGDNNKPEVYVSIGAVKPSTYARLRLRD
ncbi:hypothetical protein [Cytobacillus firmus]|uniref:hypothetical protein n=1 Tax=Cytobacillus firmus TaxID=1399 RepID=UPI0024C1C441|nr:hypothetical protein [Cytobacillus firmus]WHY59895.1 hypothetical protein QNH42_15025 [Cytobacillus firmus]